MLLCIPVHREAHRAVAAIDDVSDPRDPAAEPADDVDHFLHGSTGRDDILAHEHTLARREREAPAQLHRPFLAFGKHGAETELAPGFLRDDDPSDRRRDHGIKRGAAERFRDIAAEDFGVLGNCSTFAHWKY